MLNRFGTGPWKTKPTAILTGQQIMKRWESLPYINMPSINKTILYSILILTN